MVNYGMSLRFRTTCTALSYRKGKVRQRKVSTCDNQIKHLIQFEATIWQSMSATHSDNGQTHEKSNKCNQCNFASSKAGNLRRHLKIHSGEKSNKCNQYDYASSQEGHTNLADATNASMHQIWEPFQMTAAERVPSEYSQPRYIADIFQNAVFLDALTSLRPILESG